MNTARQAAAAGLGLLLLSAAILAAPGDPASAPEGDRANHLGFHFGPLYDLNENRTFPGLGFEYERRLPFADRRLGVGIATEIAFDEHRHYVVSFLTCFHPVGGLTLSFAPGVMFFEHRGLPSRGVIHFGAGYEFEIGKGCLGPELEIAFAGEEVHLMLGLHLGFDF